MAALCQQMLLQHKPAGGTVAKPHETLGHKQYAAPDYPADQQRHKHDYDHIDPLFNTFGPFEAEMIQKPVDMRQKPLRGLMRRNDIC